MTDFFWPTNIKPLTNKNYSTTRGSNIVSTPLSGGMPILGADITIESPPFNLNFILSNLRYQVLLNFYDATLDHGKNQFKMMLDSGDGVEEHLCVISPNTWKVSRPSDGNWYLAMTVIAESTSSQLEDCDSLYQLYSCYGDDTAKILTGLNDWVEAMPT